MSVTKGYGYGARCAFKKATTWGTAVACGAGDQVEYASESLAPDIGLLQSDQITGDALAGLADVGDYKLQGSLSGMDFKFQGHEKFIAMVLGDYAKTGSAIPYTHTMKLALDNPGLFGTLVFDKQVKLHEIDSFKPMGFTLKVESGKFVKLDVKGIGRKMAMNSVINTSVTFADVTLPTATRKLVGFKDVKTYLEALNLDTPVVPDTAFCLTAFELSCERTSNPVPTTCDGEYSSEPGSDDIKVDGTITFAQYDSDNQTILELAESKAPAVMRVLIEGEAIPAAGGAKYTVDILIPALQLTGWPAVGGKGRIPLQLKFASAVSPVEVDGETLLRIKTINELSDIYTLGA